MARPHSALIDLAAGRTMDPVADIDSLVESAIEHRLHGLLWSRVEAGEIELDPANQRSLAMLSLRSESHHRKLWRTIGAVSGRLDAIDVQVGFFKGVVAEERWYARTGERPCQDVDLVMDPAATEQVEDVLRVLSPEHPLLGSIEELANRGLIQYLELSFDGISVDLHFDILKLGFPSRRRTQIWEGFHPLETEEGRTLLVPAPGVALIQRLLALSRDRFPHLLAYSDVMRIVQDVSLDWESFDEIVFAEGLEAPIYGALRAVAEDLGVDFSHVPDPGLSLRRRLWAVAWRPSTRLLGREARSTHRRHGFMVLPVMVRGRMLDALKYWWRRLFPPRELFDFLHPEQGGGLYWRRFLRARSRSLRG